MLVAPVLAPQPGMRVLDMCSAPGGKATHVAQLMQDKGEVIACDIHEHKLELIAENAARLGMKSVKALQNDALQLRSEWLGVFDRVLVDAPCSGLGVLRRRAEARWRKQRKDLKLFPPLQLAILKNAAQYVQDDAHILCTEEQIGSEVAKFCRLLRNIYRDFGFNDLVVKFSTMPEDHVGDLATWEHAEKALADACHEAGLEYELQPGEGAFYGPKLEFKLYDTLGREWQCGTIQVDYQLPSAERLDATYIGSNNQHT